MTGQATILLRAADGGLRGTPIRVSVADTQGRVGWEELVLVGAERSLSLPCGAHTVRAALPSGLVLDSPLTVVPDRITDHVVDLDELAPAPWLTASVALSPCITQDYQDLRHRAYATSWARLWAARGRGWQPVPWPNPVVLREPTGLRLAFDSLDPVPHMVQTGVGTGPWTLTSLPLHDTVHVTVRPVWAEAPGLHVSCLTPETGAHALLGYSSNGAVHDALAVARWLLDKYSSSATYPHVLATALGHHLPLLDLPLRAAMLHRVLVSSAGTADGAVIAACGALDDMRRPGAERSADALCRLFLQATALGLPTLTQGLRHLLDALRLLAETPITHPAPVRKKLSDCAAYLAAADTRSPFLAFDGIRPDAPGHVGLYLHERPTYAVLLVPDEWAGPPAPSRTAEPAAPTPAAPHATTPSGEALRRQFRQGMRRLAHGYYDNAVTAFTAVLDADPDHVQALAGRAAAYRLLTANRAAVRDATRALELDPDNVWAYATRGAVHRLERRYPESLADLDRAIELQPDHDWCIAGRGETYRLMGKTELALEDLNRALAINPANDWALMCLIAAYLDNQQEELSRAVFDKAASALPDRDWALTRPTLTRPIGPENSYRRMGQDLTPYAAPVPYTTPVVSPPAAQDEWARRLLIALREASRRREAGLGSLREAMREVTVGLWGLLAAMRGEDVSEEVARATVARAEATPVDPATAEETLAAAMSLAVALRSAVWSEGVPADVAHGTEALASAATTWQEQAVATGFELASLLALRHTSGIPWPPEAAFEAREADEAQEAHAPPLLTEAARTPHRLTPTPTLITDDLTRLLAEAVHGINENRLRECVTRLRPVLIELPPAP